MQSCLEPLGQHFIDFSPVQCCPKIIINCTGFILIQCCLEPLGQHCIGFCPVQCCPRCMKTTLSKIFSYGILNNPLGQHYIKFWLVQCWPKSIKKTLRRRYFYPMLSGAPRTTLHRVLTCALLCKELYENIEQDVFFCIFFWSLKNNPT